MIDWDKFWAHGAFLRLSADQFMLFEGPFEKATAETADVGGFDFFGEREEWWKARRKIQLNLEDFRRSLETQLGPKTLKRSDFNPPRREDFEASFRLIQGKIQREEIEKAVPMIKTEALISPQPADLAHALFTLWSVPLNLHVYGFWMDGKGVMGATPEILFEQNASTLQSMALAGSCPRAGISDRIPLMKDPKELKEHQLVIDDLAVRLKPLGWVRKDATRVIELPTILHLMTPFEVTGVTKNPKELMRHLHPTAAMGVAPRAYGYQWLKELSDQKDRGQFGAPLFFRKGPDSGVALVAIRSLFWSPGFSRIFAGCGVVSASQQEREFAEVQAKIESVFQMLGLKAEA